MTLRLTAEQDRVLSELARAEGVSKREAVVRAITERAARVGREAEVRRLARETIVASGPLLDRLAQRRSSSGVTCSIGRAQRSGHENRRPLLRASP